MMIASIAECEHIRHLLSKFVVLSANTQARRAALAHLLFNVFGVIWVLIVFYPFVNMVCRLVGYDAAAGGQATKLPVVLSMFHTCFNVINTAILIGLVPQMERTRLRQHQATLGIDNSQLPS